MVNYLKIFVDAPTGIIAINAWIPPQELRLKFYRAEFTGQADAHASKFLNFSIDNVGTSKFIEGTNKGSTYEPVSDYSAILLPLNFERVTTESCDFRISLSNPLTSEFSYKITSLNMANFENLTLIFEFDYDSVY